MQTIRRQNITLNLLISCTLFDDKSGVILGRTVRGQGVEVDDICNGALPSIALDTDLFYITKARRKTLAVAEVVLQCIDKNNVVLEETGLGWGALGR